MSDHKEETPDSAKPAKKKGKGKLFIILALVIVLLGGGGIAAYFTLRKPADPAAAGHATEEKKHEEAATGMLSFEPFVVNLAGPGKQRFLRISVKLVVPNEEEAKEVEHSEVKVMRLRSMILELLTAQTSDHIVTADGKAALKKEIAERATHIVEPVEVSDVLFSDFVVQY